MLGRTRQAPLLISRRAQLCDIHAPSDTELPDALLDASIVDETRSHCNSRFSNLTSPNAFGVFAYVLIGV